MTKPLYDLELHMVDSQRQIARKICDKLVYELNAKIRRGSIRAKLRDAVRQAVANVLEDSPTYQELVTAGSELYHELGLLNSRGRLTAIVDKWAKSVKVNVSQFRRHGGNNVVGTIYIQGIQADYSDVLGMPEAEFLSSNLRGELTDVPWLSWLLTRGRSFVTPGYVFVRGHRPWSRTGDGIMVKMPRGGKSWQVPSAHSGTRTDNWVTRAIYGKDGGTGLGPHLESILVGVLY